MQALAIWQLFVLSIIPSGIGGFLAYHHDLEAWRPFIQGMLSLLLLSLLIKTVCLERGGQIQASNRVNTALPLMFALGMAGYFVTDLILILPKTLTWHVNREFFDQVFPIYRQMEASADPFAFPPIHYFFFAVALTPLAEEVFHRRIILTKLLQKHGATWAIIASSLWFSLLHPNNPLIAFLGGVFYGWVFVRTGQLLYVVAMHAGYNFVAYGLYRISLYQWEKDVSSFSSLSNWGYELIFGFLALICCYWTLKTAGILSRV